jgi:alkaline phosphatase D
LTAGSLGARQRPVLGVAIVGLALVAGGCKNKKSEVEAESPGARDPVTRAAPPTPPDPFDDPVTAVEVGAETARIWARVAGAAELEVAVALDGGEPIHRLAPFDADADHTARVELAGLVGGGTFIYRWTARAGDDAEVARGEGRFAVPPQAGDARPVTFAFSGDLGGQNVCRDRDRGYPIFERLEKLELGFFIGLGDMIYADNPCLATGAHGNAQIPGLAVRAVNLEEMRRAWRYNRADPGLSRLLARTGYFAVWDDHEIENNFGPSERGGLFDTGLRAFREHNPVPARRLYRSVRWGRDLELFFLDLRSFRSPNTAADDAKKTMLGAEQKAWLLAALPASSATHKVVISSVPIAVATGDETIGIDSWVGFEHELAGLFGKLAERGVTELTFLTTDVHFATAHRYRPLADVSLVVHEIIVGPMSAGLFPKRELDPTFSPERLFFHGPASEDVKLTFDEALAYMTVGIVEVDGPSMAIRVENARGDVVWRSTLGSTGTTGRPPELPP